MADYPEVIQVLELGNKLLNPRFGVVAQINIYNLSVVNMDRVMVNRFRLVPRRFGSNAFADRSWAAWKGIFVDKDPLPDNKLQLHAHGAWTRLDATNNFDVTRPSPVVEVYLNHDGCLKCATSFSFGGMVPVLFDDRDRNWTREIDHVDRPSLLSLLASGEWIQLGPGDVVMVTKDGDPVFGAV